MIPYQAKSKKKKLYAYVGESVDAICGLVRDAKERQLWAENMLAKMNGKANTNPADNQARLLNKQIDDLIGFINNKFSDSIFSPVSDLLTESLKSPLDM